MISLSEVGGLYLSTPANIKDARTKAFMYACDRQIKKLLERAEKVKVWCAIESVDEKYLDYMAADCRVLFYNSSLAPEVKRKLIANSQYWYMKLGTSAAMEEMINIVFQNNDTSIEEWYSYAGEAFHFRIAVSSAVTTVEMSEFLKYVNEVKNARSILDYLVLQSRSTLVLHNDSDFSRLSFEPCSNDFFCGTAPDYAVGLHTEESGLQLAGSGALRGTDYEPTGTTPDYAMGLQLSGEILSAGNGSSIAPFDYNMDNQTASGTTPDYAMGLQLAEGELSAANGSDTQSFDYNMDNQTESGTFPGYAMGAQFAEESLDIAESGDGIPFEYRVDNKFASEDV
ncbi:MAG: phage tail protein [Lachnospira sp.]|nr:phage tail protein [Lachnospira sp.]